jgi:TP901 family phage tail tape measure protein
MAQPFNLTVALNLKGPSNVKKVASDIQKQLGTIKANVDLKINANTAKHISAINKQLVALSRSAKSATSSVVGLNTALRKVSTAFNNANTVTKTFNKTSSQTSNNLKNSAGNVQQATTAIEEFGKQSALAVKRFAAFSIVTSVINQFTSAVSNSFSTFVEFDRQLVRIGQVTGGSASDIKALSKEIGTLASSFGVASSDLAEVSVTLAQAGLTANQTRTALEALAKTSLAATFSNINNTTEGSIALMRQFKISVEELEGSLGAINAVAANFAVESSDIITAISRAGGVFSAASRGVSNGTDALNEFIAVFTSVRATTRESAETIATGLRTIFTRIQRGSTIKFLREFGVELQDSQGKFVGAYEAVRRLSEGLEGLDARDVRFTKIVEELGGFRQIGKVIPLVQEFAVAQEALGVAQRGAGSLTSDAVKAQMALAVQFQKTQESFNNLIRDIGQSATFQTITKMVLGLANAFISVAGALKPVLPLLTAITAIKGFKFITEFLSGFKGAFGGGSIGGGMGGALGGAIGGGGSGGGGGAGGAGGAVDANTQALNASTSAIQQLTAAINNLGFGSGGGLPDSLTGIKFSRGGDVPGTGNRDTVPAMLQPGEFVIRKSAVEAFGRDNLASINKYAAGGRAKIASLDTSTIDVDDGDTFSAMVTPTGDAFQATFRPAGYDAYETGNKSSRVHPDRLDRLKQLNRGMDFPEETGSGGGRGIKIPANTLIEANRTASNAADTATGQYKSFLSGMNEKDLVKQITGEDGAFGRYLIDHGTVPVGPRSVTGRYAKMATGGAVSDTVPAMLTPGEYVINKKSAQAFGYGNLEKINGYAQGGVVDGVQYFSNGGKSLRQRVGDTKDYLGKQLKATSIQVKRFGVRIDRVSNITGSFVGTVSAAGAALIPAIDSMVNSFDQLNSTTIATSEEFMSFRGGLEGAASRGISGSLAAKEAGLGRRGTAIAAGVTAVGGAVSGAIAGQTQAREAEARLASGTAATEMTDARQDFREAGSVRQRLQALDAFTDASADYANSVEKANAEYNSETARFGRALGSLTDGIITALSVVGSVRNATRRSTGGMVYASKGQLIDFKPKGTDTVPAMLSPGEFVVNAKSTKQNKGLLQSINKSKGGMISSPVYLRNGGMPYDEAIKQGYSHSEAFAMNKDYQANTMQGGGGVLGFLSEFTGVEAMNQKGMGTGGFAGKAGYYDHLMANFNPYAGGGGLSGGMKDVAQKDVGLKRAAQASMAIGGTAAVLAGGMAAAPALLGGGATVGTAGGTAAGGGLLSGGTMLNAGLFAAGMAPAGIEAYNQYTGNNAEVIARTQAASANQFANISEGARMRGETGRLGSPVSQRAVERFNEQRASGASRDAQRAELGKLSGTAQSAGLVQEQARQTMMRQQGIDLDPGQTIEEYMQTATDAEKAIAEAHIVNADKRLKMDAFIAKRTRELESIGMDAAAAQRQIQKEIKESTDAQGNLAGAAGRQAEKEIGRQEEIASKAAKAARELQEFNRETASLTAIMTRASSSMKRLGSEIDMVVASTNDLVAAYGGQASATSAVAASSAQENVNIMKNPTAYSEAELDKALSSSVATLGGGAEVQQAADLTKASVAFEKVGPQIRAALAGDDGGMDAEGIEKMVRQGFAGADIPADIVDDFVQAATQDLAGGEGGSKNIENILKKSEQAQKFLTQASELAAKGLKAVAAQSDQVTKSMSRQRELGGNRDVRAAQQNLDARQAMGLSTSFEDLVAPSQARVRSLSSTQDLDAFNLTGTSGTTDPNQIFDNIQEMTAARETAISDARAEGPEAETALLASKSFQTLNEQINASTRALEMLESDTTAADAALQKMAAREAQLGAQADTAMDMVADPSKALKFISDAQAFSRVQAGQGGQMDIGAAQNFLKGLQGTMSEENFGKLRESTARGSARSMGLENEMQPFMPGFASTMEGKLQDPTMNREFQRLQAAGGTQNTAGERLDDLEGLKQEKLQQSITEITDKVQNGMGPIIQQINVELQTFRDNVAAANGNGAPPPPGGGVATAAPANSALAGIQFPDMSNTQVGRDAARFGPTNEEAMAFASQGGEGVTGEVALTPTAPLQVELTASADAMELMGAAGQEAVVQGMKKVADALFMQTNSTIDIRGMV